MQVRGNTCRVHSTFVGVPTLHTACKQTKHAQISCTSDNSLNQAFRFATRLCGCCSIRASRSGTAAWHSQRQLFVISRPSASKQCRAWQREGVTARVVPAGNGSRRKKEAPASVLLASDDATTSAFVFRLCPGVQFCTAVHYLGFFCFF